MQKRIVQKKIRKTNKTGVIGVCLCKTYSKGKKRKPLYYYQATTYDEDGKRRRHQLYIHVLGKTRAFKRAVEIRASYERDFAIDKFRDSLKKRIDKLNKQYITAKWE